MKNSRFWILIIGIIFLVAGFIMQKLGIPPCMDPNLSLPTPPFQQLPFSPCEDTLYLFGTMIIFPGTILAFIGVILLIAQFLARMVKGYHKKRTN